MGTLSRYSSVSKLLRVFYPSISNRLLSNKTGTMSDLVLNEEKGYAKIVMKNPAGNSFNSEMMKELSQFLSDAENSKCRGLVLTSSVKNIFSAGLNLVEFGGPGSDEDSVRKYYGSFQDLFLQLYKTPLITVAAMNGHCVAGGCAVAMACDYRILASPKYNIGMHEVIFGVPVPYLFMETMIAIMGWQVGSKAAIMGKLFNTDEALQVGLVDEICSLGDMDSRVDAVFSEYFKANQKAQQTTKLDSRQELMDRLMALKEKDLQRVTATVSDPETMKIMLAYVQSLRKPKK